jgi:O-antigen/teichoic acid export membrane protein
MPKITNQSEDLIKKTIFHKMIILSFIAIATSIFYFFAAPFLYKIFFPQYLDSIIYSQILVISVVGIVISSFFYTILEAKKNIDGIYKYNIVGGILNIIILFPLIHSFGILGAIIAKILGRFVFVVIGYVLVKNIKTE